MGTSPRYTGIYIMKFTVVGRRRGDCRVNRSRGESKICGRNIARIPVNRVEAAFVNFTYCQSTGRGEELSISPGEEFASRQAVYAETKMQIIVWRERPETILPHLPEPSGESRKGVYFSGYGTRWDECTRLVFTIVRCLRWRIRFWIRIIISEKKYLVWIAYMRFIFLYLFFFLYRDKFNFCYWIYML